MNLCSECGTQNDDGRESCAVCGARLTLRTDARQSSATTRLEERAAQPLAQEAEMKSEIEEARNSTRLQGVGEKRNPLVVLALGFLTCYVYLFYWWYVTGADLKRVTGCAEINPPVELLLNLLTCSLYSIYLSYKYPKLVLEMQEKARVAPNDTSLLSVLLSLFSLGPVACYVIQTDLNRIWEAVEQKR